MICDIRTPEGEPYAGDSRHVLERVVRRAAEDGYSFIVGPELEYFYFKDAEGTDVLDHGSYFDLTSLDSASDLRRDTVLTLEKMGFPWSTPTTRRALPSTRSTCATPMRSPWPTPL